MKEMLIKRIKKSALPVVFSVISVSAAIAAIEPNAVIMYFLPVQDSSAIDSPYKSVYRPYKTGMVVVPATENLPEKNKLDEKHGLKTSVGVSLYEKGETPLAEAEENVLAPVKVMILPPENLQSAARKKRKKVKGVPESVNPLPIRIFPLIDPKREIKPVENAGDISRFPPVSAVARPAVRGRGEDDAPVSEHEIPAWIFKQLNKCDGAPKDWVLGKLYRMMSEKRELGKTDCEIKRAVAGYLQKCHPWPAVYYTPSEHFMERERIRVVRMAIEVLSSRFSQDFCSLNLSRVNFARNEFIKTRFDGADFSYSNFDGALFTDADMKNTLFQGANLDNVLIQSSSFSKSYMLDAQMRFSHVLDSDFNMAFLENADLANTQFRRSQVVLTDFSDAKMANTDWEDVKGGETDFSNADLTKAVFNNVLMDKTKAVDADFSKIVCRHCVFRGSDMKKAQFRQSTFDTVTFENANLMEADFAKAAFTAPVVLKGTDIYGVNFKGADIRDLESVPVETLRLTLIDADTQMPEPRIPFEAASYDVEIFHDNFKQIGENAYGCTPQMCQDRLKGRVSNTNLALRAMSLIDAPMTPEHDKMWALCTMGCIARHDKKLEPSQIDILAAFVRKNAKWSSEDLFKPFSPLKPEVQAALFILTDPEAGIDPTYDIDLSGTDLRGADLSNADLRPFIFKGANLSGADMSGSVIDDTYRRFDQAVIDPFTVFPKNTGIFEPYRLPEDFARPRWWKPSTVRVIKDTVNLWYATTEEIPFSDKFVVVPVQGKTARKSEGK